MAIAIDLKQQRIFFFFRGLAQYQTIKELRAEACGLFPQTAPGTFRNDIGEARKLLKLESKEMIKNCRQKAINVWCIIIATALKNNRMQEAINAQKALSKMLGIYEVKDSDDQKDDFSTILNINFRQALPGDVPKRKKLEVRPIDDDPDGDYLDE